MTDSSQKKPNFTVTVGIECHVQLKTMTKLFAAVSNHARDAEPNTLISHICLGMPGALPVLNKKAVEYACRVAVALKTEPQRHSYFERKHYFYPDLPKGYQITQLESPIIIGGHVDIPTEAGLKRIRITRVQIEEDAGKSTHPAGKEYSLVDLNRAGTPLLEIVSEPDIHTPAEARAYARELWLLMRFARVSDADMYHGNMRFDVNVSLSSNDELGTRTETKNLNSFRSVERAVEYEIGRQRELLEKGEAIVQETRGWDDAKQKTFSQRSKEDAHDYRYFPDPDIPPVELDDKTIEDAKNAVTVLPGEWRVRLTGLGLDPAQTETLIEAEAESEAPTFLEVLETLIDKPELVKAAANLMVNTEIPLLRAGKIKDVMSPAERKALLTELYGLLQANKLSSTNAKSLYGTVLTSGARPSSLEKYAEEQGLTQESDMAAIEAVVEKVLAENPKAAEDVRNGEMKAIGFLVGQVMKLSMGKANPQLAQGLIRKKL